MFTTFSKAVFNRFKEMSQGELFTTEIPGLFEGYLAAYPLGSNPMYKKRTVHDCQCCKQFILRLGCLIGLKDGKAITVWDVPAPAPYDRVAEALHSVVSAATITGVFRTDLRRYGMDHNYAKLDNTRHDHFWGDVADRHYTLNVGTDIGLKNGTFQVFHRGLSELRASDFSDVLDLIGENGLYKGAEFKDAIVGFLGLLNEFNLHRSFGIEQGRRYALEMVGHKYAGFRGTAIGNLFIQLAEGKDFEAAVRSYESTVDATNYKRPNPIITQKQMEKAVEKIHELKVGGALHRRFAKKGDISVNDVLFVANDVALKDSVTALLEGAVSKGMPVNPIPVKADEFVATVLPGAKTVELLLENRHSGNFVSLTGGDGPERLFKWNNNFAWSYDGDTTDSVKQRVKAAGGKVNCDVRVSLSWFNYDDLDLHCICPYGHVHWADKKGILDVDMNAHSGKSRSAVENLAFNKPSDGEYKVFVQQFCKRENEDVGFAIEIEAAGVVHSYSYPGKVVGDVMCFTLRMKGGKLEAIKAADHLIKGSSSSEKWGLKTHTLVPVELICYSPNHWGGAVGARHTIFALKGCHNPEPCRGIYNEFLRAEFESHRKVFEVLGARTKCPVSSEQVSGVGFTQARGDSVTVLVDGRRSYTLEF